MIRSIGKVLPQIDPTAYVHETAEVSGNVILGPRVSIWPYVVLRGDVERIEIGAESNVQDSSVFHTSHGLPVVLGKGVTVGHGAIVHGCRIGDWSLVGMGAILLDGCIIGSECFIGAGALVKEGAQIPNGQLALGLPAKVVRPLNSEEIKTIHQRAEAYIRYAETYKRAKIIR